MFFESILYNYAYSIYIRQIYILINYNEYHVTSPHQIIITVGHLLILKNYGRLQQDRETGSHDLV